MLPALRIALEGRGLRGRLPPRRADHLRAAFVLHASKRRAQRRQMIALNELFGTAGIRPVWLKGAESLLDPDFASGARVMYDLDVWIIDEGEQQEALRLMAAAGWRTFAEDEAKRGWERSHHFKPMQHADWPVPVELHRTLLVRDQAAVLPLGEVVPALRWIDWDGGRCGRLDPVSGAALAAVQASTMAYAEFSLGRVPLMKSLDFVQRLDRDFGGTIPPALRSRLETRSARRSADQLLTFTAEYFGTLPPPRPQRRYIRAVERDLTHPRLNTLLGNAGDFIERRTLGLLREPERLSEMVRDWAGGLTRRPPA